MHESNTKFKRDEEECNLHCKKNEIRREENELEPKKWSFISRWRSEIAKNNLVTFELINFILLPTETKKKN
jgi:hypothetical protein